jgi:hypothetical protein
MPAASAAVLRRLVHLDLLAVRVRDGQERAEFLCRDAPIEARASQATGDIRERLG